MYPSVDVKQTNKNGAFSFSRRRLASIWLAFVAMATIGCEATTPKTVNVECDSATLAANPSACFVAQPFTYGYNDSMTINGGSDQIFEFSVSYGARMQSIPAQLWAQLPYLEQLKLRGVELQLLHPSDFENAWNLHNISLGYNNLTFISSMLFSRAVKLMAINLEANHIQTIEEYAFNGLYQLYYLDLSRNNIISLNTSVFYGAPHLIDLRLEHNLIQTLQPGVFELPDLMFLYLNNNQLKTLPDDCFRHTQLIGLDLSTNDLVHVGNATYTPNTLRTLLLSFNNKIVDLNVTRIREDLKQLSTFKYDQNLQLLS